MTWSYNDYNTCPYCFEEPWSCPHVGADLVRAPDPADPAPAWTRQPVWIVAADDGRQIQMSGAYAASLVRAKRYSLRDPQDCPPELIAAIAGQSGDPTPIMLPVGPQPIDRTEPDWPKAKRSPESRFIADVLGWPMLPLQQRAVDIIYGRDVETGIFRWGRRAGKGRTGAAVAVTEATLRAEHHLKHAPAGEEVAVIIVARAQRQARRSHAYAKQFVKVAAPKLGLTIVRETLDEIALSNGMTIMVMPCHAATTRGAAAAVVIFDELAWFEGRDGSVLDAREVWNALEPSAATMPSRRILVLSSPRYSGSFFSDLCALGAKGEDGMLELVATTPQIRPDIEDAYFERRRARDPDYYRREFEASFEAGEGAALPADLVERAAIHREELAPMPQATHILVTDPAMVGDRWAWIVAHMTEQGVVVFDRVHALAGSRSNPVGFDAALDALTADAKRYNRAHVYTDQHMAEAVRQGLQRRGVGVTIVNWTSSLKLNALAAFRELLFEDRLELQRHRGLIEELIGLRQTVLPSGVPKIGAASGKHDDFAHAALMAVERLRAGVTGRVTHALSPWA